MTKLVILQTFAIFILLGVIILRPSKPIQNIAPQYLDSINVLNRQIQESKLREDKLLRSNDSLSLVKQRIIYKTHEEIKFIYFNADINQLDSIVRTATRHNPMLYNN